MIDDREHGVDPVAHARVRVAQHARVAEALVQHPRHDGRGVAPGGGRAADAERGKGGRHDERHHAVRAALLVREVAQPRREERVAVGEEARGGREDLDVARPAEALVALRAVGGDREEVAAHAPHDVLVQAVEQLVRRREPARAGQVAREHDRGHVGRVELARPALDRGVAEAVEREPRLPLDRAVAGELEHVGRDGVAQRTERELAVLEHLGVPQGEARARRAVHPDAESADEVLAEVEDRGARRRREHLGHRQLVDAAHGRRDARLGHRHVLVPLASGCPAAGLGPRRRVEPGGRPAVDVGGAAQVGVLAGVDAAVDDGAVAEGPPAVAGGDDLGAAVGVLEVELGEEARLVAVDAVGELEEAVLLGVPGARDRRRRARSRPRARAR